MARFRDFRICFLRNLVETWSGFGRRQDGNPTARKGALKLSRLPLVLLGIITPGRHLVIASSKRRFPGSDAGELGVKKTQLLRPKMGLKSGVGDSLSHATHQQRRWFQGPFIKIGPLQSHKTLL